MSSPLPGYVYYDPNFKFSNGSQKGKLFVVLCDSPLDTENVLTVLTTSKPKSEPELGCYLDRYPPCFHLPSNVNQFDGDTWIMLDSVYEIQIAPLEKLKRKTDLTVDHTISLLRCGSESQYLAEWQTEAFRNEVERLR